VRELTAARAVRAVAARRLMTSASGAAVSRRTSCGEVPVGAAPTVAMSARSTALVSLRPNRDRTDTCSLRRRARYPELVSLRPKRERTDTSSLPRGDRGGIHDASDDALFVALFNSRYWAALEVHRRRVGFVTHGNGRSAPSGPSQAQVPPSLSKPVPGSTHPGTAATATASETPRDTAASSRLCRLELGDTASPVARRCRYQPNTGD